MDDCIDIVVGNNKKKDIDGDSGRVLRKGKKVKRAD